MAKNTCGKTTVVYDNRCSWECNCGPSVGCTWTVSCPDGKGGTIETTGTGFTTTPPRHPSVAIAGNLAGCARLLQKRWKRPVIVPPTLRSKTIRRRTLKGTPEEIAHSLGLQLGPRRPNKRSRRQ
jgi:hypothetical protein